MDGLFAFLLLQTPTAIVSTATAVATAVAEHSQPTVDLGTEAIKIGMAALAGAIVPTVVLLISRRWSTRDRDLDKVWAYVQNTVEPKITRQETRLDAANTKSESSTAGLEQKLDAINAAIFNLQLDVRESKGFADTLRDIVKQSLKAGLAPTPPPPPPPAVNSAPRGD